MCDLRLVHRASPTGAQQKQLFEYWAGDSNKNITFPTFERALNKDSDASSRSFGKDCIGLLVRELTVTSPKLLAGDSLPSRVCVLLDFLKQVGQPRDPYHLAPLPLAPSTRRPDM